MKKGSAGILILILLGSFRTLAQDKTDTVYKRPKDTMDLVVSWKQIGNGVHFCETDAPVRSIIGDSKLTILKIDPKQVEFDLFTASAMDSVSKPVNVWADTMNLNIVFNAGMYALRFDPEQIHQLCPGNPHARLLRQPDELEEKPILQHVGVCP